MGYGAFGPSAGGAELRRCPARVYFDLSTWHLINTVYQPARVAELKRAWRAFTQPGITPPDAGDSRLPGPQPDQSRQQAKIDVATTGLASLDLHLVERGLQAALKQEEAAAAHSARPATHCRQRPQKPCNGLA